MTDKNDENDKVVYSKTVSIGTMNANVEVTSEDPKDTLTRIKTLAINILNEVKR